jgi:hypothetical protein
LLNSLGLTLTIRLESLRVSIEAGGNAPFIVFGDADIDQAVEGKPDQLICLCAI